MICFSASLLSTTLQAQLSSTYSVAGELRSRGPIGSSDFVVEVYDERTNALIDRAAVDRGQFRLDRVPAGSFLVRLVTAPGEAPLVEQFHVFGSGGEELVLDLPERSVNKPISGFVSLHDLEHPVPKKAIREAYQAQEAATAKDYPKAIEKLEKAIRIDPSYRDAHLNLGVQYARAGRSADARAQFQKALEIGPPQAPIYADLALTSLALHQRDEAEAFAHKALEMDPENSAAQRVLQFTASH